jgi:hypothetical protein
MKKADAKIPKELILSGRGQISTDCSSIFINLFGY